MDDTFLMYTNQLVCDFDGSRKPVWGGLPLVVGALFFCFFLTGVAQAADKVIAGVDPEFSALIARCAPTVDPETMMALVSAESRGHQYAIADAGPVHLPWSKRKSLVRSYYMGSMDAATEKATTLIAAGHTVSLGLAQINDRNLARMGLSVREMFDPCTNLSAGGKIVTEFYQRAVRKFGTGGRALRAAISAYNSGDWIRGERDGYVNLVYKQLGRPLAMKSNGVISAPQPPQSKAVVPQLRSVMANDNNQGLIEKNDDSGRQFSMAAKDFSVAE